MDRRMKIYEFLLSANITLDFCRDGGIKPPCMTLEALERRCPGWKSSLISLTDSLIKELNYCAESVSEITEDCPEAEACDNTDNRIDKETKEVTCPPGNQNLNKGNGKKAKQKKKRKGKGKKR